MKILIFSSNSSSRGGGERFLINLAKSLKGLGNNVEIVLSTNKYMDSWSREFEELNLNIHRYNLKALAQRKLRFVSAILDFYQIKKIKDICNQIMPNLIIVNQQYDEDGLDYIKGALSSKISNVIGFIHMPMTNSKKDRPLGFLRMKLLKSWYYKNPYKVVFCSEGSKTEFKNFYKKIDNVFVVNNSIPLFKVRDYSDYYKRRKNCDMVNLTFVGQFVPQKNLFLLIEIWKKLLVQGFKVKLSLIGDGPLFEKIKISLNEIESKLWHLEGWCEDVDQFLEETDIYLMTSLFEGCPLSLIEAASKGIHCIVNPFNGASDIKKYAEWIHISETFKSEDFLSSIKSVIVKKVYLKKISKNSLKIFREYFSLKRMGEEIIEITKNG
tara:strand:+ start:21487 stop:22632 length:1146 start_codon:yes stop_codon:yes gene_type:complete